VAIVGGALGFTAAVIAAILAHDRLFHGGTRVAAASVETARPADDPKTPAHDPKTTVVMPEGKFKMADIRVEPVDSVELPREVSIAGRIEPEVSRRVDVHAKTTGVIRSVTATPGMKVKAGDVLAVLDSPDIGAARLLVRERQRALATARTEAAYRDEVAATAEAMISRLRAGASAQQISREFAEKQAGAARGTLISAWAELEIAEHEFQKQDDLNKRNIVGEHPVFLAQHQLEAAQAKFDGLLGTVRFEVSQAARVGRQMVRGAEEMVVEAAQRLKVLGVKEDVAALLAHPEAAATLPSESEDLTSYPIVAPIDATVMSSAAVASLRVEMTDSLFLLVDASKVYAVANVPESLFADLVALGNGKVRVQAAAYPGRTFPAKILYRGNEVDPTTKSVRLVAVAENPDGMLNVGQFVDVLLDTRETEKVTTVPKAAVVEVENSPAVFVPGQGERTFVIRPVKLGREALGRQVITQGLKAGDRVVTAGAFLVKSELILQNEVDEE
jgi:RND family efflux transporter MFP subunit